ncbi:MAG: AAA family ATPase [Armatimonadetes bacterium]|nr:AAA family ATPase [Armatimonadota bacterium]
MSAHEKDTTGERRPVTVMFADIAGFTALAERLDPETVTDTMNEIFTALGAEVEAVGGTVDKVIGDSLMALFGAPVAHEDDPMRAVRAALAMQRVMEARRPALEQALGGPVRLRIGIHSGPVIWGQVGPAGHQQWTVMGDTVNLASRLQRAAPEGGVLISDAVSHLVRGAFVCKAWEPIVMKGKAEPVAVYEVLGERERAEPIARPPFVDREQDLSLLNDLFARVLRGRAQVVMVIGDAGVGKTRLVEEYLRQLPGDAALLQTACPRYGGRSLAPLADLFRQFAGLHGPVTVQEVEARIPLGERSAQAAVVLSRLFNLADVPPDDGVSRETALVMAAEAIRKMLTRTTVVWIEDLQWADAGTREVLPFIVERLHETPLLLIGTLRAGEDPPAWGRRTAVHALQLDPLSDDDARTLLQAIVGGPLADDVERAIVTKAGGNPFYLSEIVATLRSRGTLILDDRGRWQVRGSVESVLPDSVQGALLARLDRLPPDLRAVVQRAAVVGALFRQSLIAALCPEVDVPAGLQQLEDAYLLRRQDPLAADPEYTFAHPLLREVASSSLLSKQQVALHRQVAATIERVYPGQSQELAKVIGMHYALGGSPGQALPYLLTAGKDAIRRYATREAMELLEQARALAEETGQVASQVEACEALGDIYPHIQGRDVRHRAEAWQYVVDHLDPAAEPLRAARAMLAAAECKALENRPDQAFAMLERAKSLIPADHLLEGEWLRVRSRVLLLPSETRFAEAADDARQAVEIANRRGTLLDRARAYYALSHPALLPLLGDEGTRMIREWAAEAERSGEEGLLTEATMTLLSDSWTRGLVDDNMLRMAADALRRAEAHELTGDEARLRTLLGWAMFLIGRWPDADRHLSRAFELITAREERIQEYGFLIVLPYFRGNLAMARGQAEEARQIFEEALVKPRFHAPIWLNHDLARCQWMLGDHVAARASMERALAARDALRCIVCGCQANGFASEFYASMGEAGPAETLGRAAEETAAAIGHITTRIRVRRTRARLALQRGEAREAVEAAQEAVGLKAQMPMPQPFEHGQSLLLLGEAHRAAGALEPASAAWEEARGVFATLGAAWHLGLVDAALSRARSGA